MLMTLIFANMLIAILMLGYDNARLALIDAPSQAAFNKNVGNVLELAEVVNHGHHCQLDQTILEQVVSHEDKVVGHPQLLAGLQVEADVLSLDGRLGC